ncbi:MAG: AmmeMemoRadiSam system protein B [Anaerolineae bacterium CG_4_9_14_3_um_filter_57_17]|nr:AmmeMemoRadiSam system protein B [bacterium]NCT19858.1 AmmeMemoRadiSam system protein B [bacterium]OIO83515.1 MAG: AmmeMemoRadiSam system protein B [Anaerolineae bacterium CG2_30_57_67]PJB67265.1 MAG: AmmeMemoRadiSam system protein B [Anaerolineae bacterium CG_4_9_14_3_um_filter_57_17]
MPPVSSIRPSPIAGTWYEANPQLLARQIDTFLGDAPALKDVVALIAPHAGHRYSGAVAGPAYAAVRGCTPQVVAILAPMHAYHPAPLLTSAHAFYSTPLGNVSVDTALVDVLNRELVSRLEIGLTPVANDPEHALEIQLPFVLRAIKTEFTLLPVMLRAQTRLLARALGEALAATLKGKNALLIASSDLSHFYPQAIARRLDDAMLETLARFDPDGLFDLEESGRGEACGLGALAAVLWAARALGGENVHVLARATSGDVTGDYERVVGYGSAVVCKAQKTSVA